MVAMKNMNKRNIFAMTFFVVIFIFTYNYWLPEKVVGFYNSENDNGSYIVTISMAPRNMTGAIQFWLENKK